MITDEQARAAAERLVGDEYDNSDGSRRRWRDDRMTCVEWAIQELSRREQHDDGPITAEWLESIGAYLFGRHWTIDVDAGQVALLRTHNSGVWWLTVNHRLMDWHPTTRHQLLALLAALRGEPSGNPGQLPAIGQQVWIVGRVFLDASQLAAHGVAPWTFQGVFFDRENAVAACRDGHYFIAPVKIGEPFPHAPAAMPGAEFPAVDAVDLGEMLGKSRPHVSRGQMNNISPSR